MSDDSNSSVDMKSKKRQSKKDESDSEEEKPVKKSKASAKKKAKVDSDSDSSDSGAEEIRKSAKKPAAKSSEKPGKSGSKKRPAEEDEDGEFKLDIGNKRFVQVREFKGKALIDIREFYMDNNTGELKPGKKGIALSAEQWRNLVKSVDKVDKALEDL